MPDPIRNLPRGRPIQKGEVLGRPFRKGEGGRKPGARNKLKEAFLEAALKDFDQHGIGAIERLREEDPVAYVRMIVGLIPKEVNGIDDGSRLPVPAVLVIKAWEADAP